MVCLLFRRSPRGTVRSQFRPSFEAELVEQSSLFSDEVDGDCENDATMRKLTVTTF